MAWRSSGKQGEGVYFVCPLSKAALAASLIKAGVSKSGSPAPKPTTSTPAFFSAAALALTARVMDSETRFIRSATGNMVHAPKDQRTARRSLALQNFARVYGGGGGLSFVTGHLWDGEEVLGEFGEGEEGAG